MIRICVLAVTTSLLAGSLTMAQADPELERRVAEVEQKVASQERELTTLKEQAGIGFFVLFLFGFVLSMWAMNRSRDGCGWFILGFIPVVNIVAAIVALSAENERRKAEARP